MRNLASSTEAQEVFQDHGRSAISKERYRQGVDLVLGKTRFGGFFFVYRKALAYFHPVAAAEGCVRQLLQGEALWLKWSKAYAGALVCPLFTLNRCD